MKYIKTIAELKEYLGWDDEIVLDWLEDWVDSDSHKEYCNMIEEYEKETGKKVKSYRLRVDFLRRIIGELGEEEFCDSVLSFRDEEKKRT